MTRTRRKSTPVRRAGKSADSSSVLLWALGGVAVLGLGYMILKPSTASALPPPRCPRGTTQTPPIPRSAVTSAKPMMPADLRAFVGSSDRAKLAFWTLAALYSFDNGAGVPTKASVETLALRDNFTREAGAALLRQEIPEDVLDTVAWYVFQRTKGRRISLPYQVPTDLWNLVNVYTKDFFSSDGISLSEPE